MNWSEYLSLAAILVALASAWVGFRGYRIAAVQALPNTPIGGIASYGGMRSIDFDVESIPGRPDWVVESASIKWNLRRRPHLAHGYLDHSKVGPDGEVFNYYMPKGPWEHQITFDPPTNEGGFVLHSEAPDCQIRLKLVLTTSPSPTIVRYIKSKRYGPLPSQREGKTEAEQG